VRCRTDGEREVVQAHIESRGANVSMFLCASAELIRRRDRTGTGGRCNPASAASCASLRPESQQRKVNPMLYTIAVVLVILWLLGLVTSYTLGGFIHVLLVIAVVMIMLNFINGRRAL
jgi:Family of unknown function (DUF5670)